MAGIRFAISIFRISPSATSMIVLTSRPTLLSTRTRCQQFENNAAVSDVGFEPIADASVAVIVQ